MSASLSKEKIDSREIRQKHRFGHLVLEKTIPDVPIPCEIGLG